MFRFSFSVNEARLMPGYGSYTRIFKECLIGDFGKSDAKISL